MAERYHHGDLRAAVLARAGEVIAAEGPQALSLRSLAADVGVSHTAPRHHFGNRRGVLTAVAAQGYRLLADRLAAESTLLDAGVAYVEFARDHPAHFAVMFAPSQLDPADEALLAARAATNAALRRGVETMQDAGRPEDPDAALVAAWAIVHGIATLALTGNLDDVRPGGVAVDDDLLEFTRRTAALLYRGTVPPAARDSG